MQKMIIITGIAIVIIGLAWPWLVRLPLGRLPGDIVINRPNLRVYFPVTSMIILSILLSVILWIIRK